MLKFYEFKEKVQTESAQLSWSHYCELLSIDQINIINYYIKVTEWNKLSVRQLRDKIKNKEYERLPEETRNNISNDNKIKIDGYIKNSIVIKNNSNYEIISEKTLQKLILEDIPSFLKELGNGFLYN